MGLIADQPMMVPADISAVAVFRQRIIFHIENILTLFTRFIREIAKLKRKMMNYDRRLLEERAEKYKHKKAQKKNTSYIPLIALALFILYILL